ncbi:hypothetical protein AAWM_04242 [Aspergillus awamori]|uniref:Rhodopsin domain-containing protein n=1 Tax=Aspergillus awamori TaxID=105351 RepID=A0A401KQ32_ASPAW|nr:hypothetical protein AAWM_04242 [Aspergillus awamori]
MGARDLDPTIVAIFGQPPAHINLAVSQVRQDNAAVVSLLVLSIIAVVLRFIVRLAVRNPFRLDDWLILVSLVREQHVSVFVAATAGLSLAGSTLGAGKQVWAVSLADISSIFKVGFVRYFSSVSAYKLSILFFYRRVFVVVHQPLSLRLSILFGFLLALSYPVIVWVAMGNCCRPLSYFWNQFLGASGTCIDTDTFFLATGIINMCQRHYNSVHPLSTDSKAADKPPKKKLLVCVASAVRIYVLYRCTQARDITWMMGPLFIWSTIEPSVAIVCACLPHLGPLVRLTRIRILSSQGSKGNHMPFTGSPWQSSCRHEGRTHWQAGIQLSPPRHVRALSSTCGVAEDEVGLAIHGTADTTAQHTPSLRSTSECPIPDHSIVVRSSLGQTVSYR